MNDAFGLIAFAFLLMGWAIIVLWLLVRKYRRQAGHSRKMWAELYDSYKVLWDSHEWYAKEVQRLNEELKGWRDEHDSANWWKKEDAEE